MTMAQGSDLEAGRPAKSAAAFRTISEVAREIDACLIVCGQRGRGAFASAVLGSVSHQLSAHAERPLLIAPQHPAP